MPANERCRYCGYKRVCPTCRNSQAVPSAPVEKPVKKPASPVQKPKPKKASKPRKKAVTETDAK